MGTNSFTAMTIFYPSHGVKDVLEVKLQTRPHYNADINKVMLHELPPELLPVL